MSWFGLCKSKKTILKPDFFNSVNQIPVDHWNSVLKSSNVFLSLPYLKSLEDSMADQVEFRYIVFYDKQGAPSALASVQIIDFSNDIFKKNEVYCKVADKIKNKVLDALDIKMMVCGNVFACGENGFVHVPSLSTEDAYQNLSDGLYELRKQQKAEKPISVVLLKEFWPATFEYSDHLKSAGFKEFRIDVNMVLKIHKDWKSMDDYMGSMTTK